MIANDSIFLEILNTHHFLVLLVAIVAVVALVDHAVAHGGLGGLRDDLRAIVHFWYN